MLLFFILLGCPTLTNLYNGILSCDQGGDEFANFGDICFVSCNNGYELIGNNIRICQTDGSWSHGDAICVISE